MGRLYWIAALILLCLWVSSPVAAEQPKPLNPKPASEGLPDQFLDDFYSGFAPEALVLGPNELRAAYDVLTMAADRIHDGKYKSAAEVLAVLPNEVEVLLRPVVAMREDMAMADAVRPFAENDARGELMNYHATVWTSHPEYAEDFAAFSEDFALRASRRERTKGVPYIVDKLNVYGFVPKGAGGPQQAYLFLWNKFNAISKFADTCIDLGLDYKIVKMDEYDARVAWILADKIEEAKKASLSDEGGRETWSKLIEYYAPEEDVIEEEPPAEETPEESLLPSRETTTTEEDETPVEEETPQEVEEEIPEAVEEAPIEEEEPEVVEEDESLPIDILINPLSLFKAPGETPVTEPVPEEIIIETIEEPVEEPVEEIEEPVEEFPIETIEPDETESIEIGPAEIEPTESVSEPIAATPAVIPGSMVAQPVSPDEMHGELMFGTAVESGSPENGTTTQPPMGSGEIRIKLSRIAESAIDNAAEKGLDLGNQAVELARLLSADPGHENQETKDQLGKYRASRSNFLAAVAIIDRYRMEQYVDVPIKDIEAQILAEVERPYGDLKASAQWDQYRENESDFEDAFARIKSDFLNRRKSETIYAGEMAALETHILDYEELMIQLEELLAMESAGRQTDVGKTAAIEAGEAPSNE